MVRVRLARGTNVPLLALAAFLGACRDVSEVFQSDDRPHVAAVVPIRLTFSTADDRSPTWSPTSDTVYYSGRSQDLMPDAPATILALALDGDGLARTVLRNVQVGTDAERWLVTPSRSRDGRYVAFVNLDRLASEDVCPYPDATCTRIAPSPHILPEPGASPRLIAATIHAREVLGEGSIFDDPGLSIDMASTEDDTIFNVPGMATTLSRYHPYQFDHIIGRDYPFRPSWAPDGARIVVSDGMRLLLWDLESRIAEPIAGTQDGTSPAWSPDGERIAFVSTERTDSVFERCAWGFRNPISDTVNPLCWDTRVKYVTAPPRIVLIRPDGSDPVILAEGRDPAWAPDGTLLFGGPRIDTPMPLSRYDPVTVRITQLPGTTGAREPAVSPDGRWVAFSLGQGDYFRPRDIWVASLE